jgi:hypothetical protein
MRHLIEKNSKLLLVKLNGEYVYGGIFSCTKNKIIASFSGIMDGYLKYLKQGLGAASYYFLILWAKENGFDLLNFGNSKPFLNDGLLRYKRKWGMSIKKAESNYPGIFSFKIINNCESIQSFLTNNPLITLENNHLKGIFFLNDKHRIASEDLQRLIEIYNIPNLKEFNFKSAKNNSLILSV